ncbi:hypothetical protein HDV03_002431, partial [Kappamyces sp. JEL0829]
MQAHRQSLGQEHIETHISDPILHKAKRNPMTLSQMGLAPKSHGGKTDTSKPYCVQYANHGFCVSGKACPFSHDLDLILDDMASVPKSKKQKTAPAPDGKGGPGTAGSLPLFGNL